MRNSTLLEIALNAINDEFNHENTINKTELIKEYDFLQNEQASFVTLNLDGRLRGCIGSLLPQRRLIDDIIYNAKAAAFRDYRFQPLNKDELKRINIEISLLTIPKTLIYESIDELKEKIKVGKDGVIIKHNNNQATFLPQVWDELSDFDMFFNHLCLKAGLEIDCLKHYPEIYTYQVEKIK